MIIVRYLKAHVNLFKKQGSAHIVNKFDLIAFGLSECKSCPEFACKLQNA